MEDELRLASRFLDEEFYNLVDALELARSSANMTIALRDFARRCGFDAFAFAQVRSGITRVISNYPQAWQHRYAASNYIAIDPVVATAKRSSHPFTWSVEEMRKQTEPVRNFATEAAEFGIRSGFTVPLKVGFGGTAILSLASAEQEPLPVQLRDIGPALSATAFAHINLVRLADRVAGIAEVGLSVREATCLKWAALGMHKDETAVIMGLSQKTVRYYLDRAMEKLNSRNVTQAVGEAKDRRLI